MMMVDQIQQQLASAVDMTLSDHVASHPAVRAAPLSGGCPAHDDVSGHKRMVQRKGHGRHPEDLEGTNTGLMDFDGFWPCFYLDNFTDVFDWIFNV